jgi:hypothetical protein
LEEATTSVIALHRKDALHHGQNALFDHDATTHERTNNL